MMGHDCLYPFALKFFEARSSSFILINLLAIGCQHLTFIYGKS